MMYPIIDITAVERAYICVVCHHSNVLVVAHHNSLKFVLQNSEYYCQYINNFTVQYSLSVFYGYL